MLFFATNTASTTIDFSKKNLDDGIIDSPRSEGPWRLPIVLASPLKGSPSIAYKSRSPSPTFAPSKTPHRQLYKFFTDEVLMHAHVMCGSTAIHIHLQDIHPRSTMQDYLCIEDNLPSISLYKDLQ